MKKIVRWAGLLTLCVALQSPAQDAAVEERLNQLSGKIDNLIEGQEAQRKRIADLTREIEELRDQQNKPQPTYASQEDLKRLADALQQLDRKRLEDYDKIRAELLKLGRTISESAPTAPRPQRQAPKETTSAEKPPRNDSGFEYVVEKNDTLSVIAQRCRQEKNLKVTPDQILKANPGLKPERLRVGQKIFIPAPPSS
jgi:LysM repeat protein